MSTVVCPTPKVSGFAVTPLKVTPETADPPSENGTEADSVGVPETVTGMLNVPSLSLTVSLAEPNCTTTGSLMVIVLTDGSAEVCAPGGRAQGECQRLGRAGRRVGACR